MSGNVRFTARQLKALGLLSVGELSQEEVAEAVGVTPKTVYRWLRNPEFAAALAGLVKEIQDAVMTTGIANKRERVSGYSQRRQQFLDIVRERGWMAEEPRMIGQGQNATEVTIIRFDAALARELRELEKQAAIEVGQWAEKREVTGAGGKPLAVVEVPSDPERAAAVIKVLAEAGVITPEGGDG